MPWPHVPLPTSWKGSAVTGNLLSCITYRKELRKAIPAITEKMLIQHLKQLETDQLVIREARPVVPPFVTYRLTDAGKGLLPVIDAMATWAMKHMEGTYN